MRFLPLADTNGLDALAKLWSPLAQKAITTVPSVGEVVHSLWSTWKLVRDGEVVVEAKDFNVPDQAFCKTPGSECHKHLDI